MNADARISNALAVRLMLGAAAALLAASLFLPLWFTELESPQYHGEDAIVVSVYAGRVTGNLREVQTLNQYVGVRLPLDAPELRALPYALGAFLALTVAAILMPAAIQKRALVANFAVMAAAGFAGAALLQYRLYQLGHERTRSILRGFPNFTPPIVGSMHLANFHVETGLRAGGWAFALAIVLTGTAAWLVRRRTVRMTSAALACAT